MDVLWVWIFQAVQYMQLFLLLILVSSLERGKRTDVAEGKGIS